MRSAPSRIAWSRKALNLISALHSTSGLGVRPAPYSRRNSAKTRSLYSAAKLTCSISMPITSATLAASMKSWRDEQYSSSSSSSQFFMKMATTSQPCCLSSQALTAESTPPLKPTTTRGLRSIYEIIPARPYPHAGPAQHPRPSTATPFAHGHGRFGRTAHRPHLAAAAIHAGAAGGALRGHASHSAGERQCAHQQSRRHLQPATQPRHHADRPTRGIGGIAGPVLEHPAVEPAHAGHGSIAGDAEAR